MNWERYLNWFAFSKETIFAAFQEHPGLIQYFPFTDENIGIFPWLSFKSENWIEVNRLLPENAILRKIGKLVNGENVTAILKEHPFLSKFCSWDKVSAADWCEILETCPDILNNCDWDQLEARQWFQILAMKPAFAAKCKCQHWQKIVSYIESLNKEDRHSIKRINATCWEQREEIINNAIPSEIAQLPPAAFYELLDFMDWEWSKRFSWSHLDKAAIRSIVVKHPEFAENHWDIFSSEEIVTLAQVVPEFLDCYADKFTRNEVAQLLKWQPSLYPKFKQRFSLLPKDYFSFEYYGNERLRGKVAFYHILVTQLVIFFAGWCFLYNGNCGFKAFRSEHPQSAHTAFYIYTEFALVWSWIQAKLHQYCGGAKISRCLGVTCGIIGVMLYGYTFFLTYLPGLNYLCFVFIMLLYMMIMYRIRRSYLQKFFSEPPVQQPPRQSISMPPTSEVRGYALPQEVNELSNRPAMRLKLVPEGKRR